MHGFGTSPIVYENLVILHNSQRGDGVSPGEQPGRSRMMAFDAQTGSDVWETPFHEPHVSYSVPCIYQPAGGPPELICASTGQGVFSLDPNTGSKNWALGGLFEMRVCSSPIIAGGHIISSNGSGAYAGNYVVAVRPGPEPSLAYHLTNSRDFKASYVPCAVAHGDHVFLLYDRGFASCFNARTGEVKWCERTGANFSGSPVLVDDRIYGIDENGVVWVIAADENELRVLAKNPLGEESRSTPAVAGGRMFLRTYSRLIAVGEPDSAVGG
jgi:outer membrane protein assembly factor BamB